MVYDLKILEEVEYRSKTLGDLLRVAIDNGVETEGLMEQMGNVPIEDRQQWNERLTQLYGEVGVKG